MEAAVFFLRRHSSHEDTVKRQARHRKRSQPQTPSRPQGCQTTGASHFRWHRNAGVEPVSGEPLPPADLRWHWPAAIKAQRGAATFSEPLRH